MEQTSYSKLSQRDVDRAETDLLINLSTLTQRGLAKMIGCHESKISRTDWRFIASVLCAFGMASDISPIIPAWANDGVALKLAVQVCMDNVIQPSDALLTAADSAYQTICIALTKVPPLERRNDMPRGSGNKSAFTWNRFYIEKDDPST